MSLTRGSNPPVVSDPMPGEPAATALAEAQLAASSCEDYQKVAKKIAEAQIKEMRVAVDESFKQWHDDQPECWAESRWRAREERELLAGDPMMLDSFGSGGLSSRPSVRMGGAAVSGGSWPSAPMPQAVMDC